MDFNIEMRPKLDTELEELSNNWIYVSIASLMENMLSEKTAKNRILTKFKKQFKVSPKKENKKEKSSER